MTRYQAAPNHNNASGLQTLDPQPRNNSDIQYPEFFDAADSSTIPAGAQFVELTFSAKYSKLSALLARFGLSLTVFSAECTVRLHKDDDTWANFNGTASWRTGKTRGPAGGRYWRGFTIIVRKLEAI
jgi:hypothetical protein